MPAVSDRRISGIKLRRQCALLQAKAIRLRPNLSQIYRYRVAKLHEELNRPRAAEMNVVIGNQMAYYVHRCGVSSARISLIHNWSDGRSIRPVSRDENLLRQGWGLDGKFVVGYSGNLGRGHEFGTILGAAKVLMSTPNIVFLFIGAGHHLKYLESTAREWGLTNVAFRPYQPPNRLSESLAAADLHLVTLQPWRG